MKKLFLSILFIIGVSTLSFGQFYSASWDLAIGAGDTHDYISKGSLRGVTFIDARKFITPQFSVGGLFSWNVLYDRVEGTFTEDNKAVTGRQYRYINAFPLMVTTHYYLDEDPDNISFYVGGGAGAIIIEKKTDMGLFTSGEGNKWQFGFQPQVGVLYPLSRNIDFHLVFKYNHAFKVGDYDKVQYFSMSLGLVWW